jgi:sugar transferase (PEP-CTERM/EpsH1 system associated)
MIRVLHVVDNLGQGGLEHGLVNVIEQTDPARFEHAVIAIRALGWNAGRLSRQGVPVECLETAGGLRLQIPALARVIRKFEPDIVHSRNWGAIEAVPAARSTRSCAVVHSEHGLEAGANATEPWRRSGFRRLAYELAHRVIAVSCHLRDLHSRRTGFPPERIGVIHNGVDTRRFFPSSGVRVRLRRELGIQDGQLCIGCVGNLLPVKDHITLLRALHSSSGELGPWRLLVAGEGPERTALQAFVDAHDELRQRVHFLGATGRVAELLNALDIYVLPSVAEGLSNSLLEAMATGLPAIATAVGGNVEVIEPGESGLLFPVGDSAALAEHLCLIERRVETRKKLAYGALQRITGTFSIQAMIHQYERLYEGLAPALHSPVQVTAGF